MRIMNNKEQTKPMYTFLNMTESLMFLRMIEKAHTVSHMTKGRYTARRSKYNMVIPTKTMTPGPKLQVTSPTHETGEANNTHEETRKNPTQITKSDILYRLSSTFTKMEILLHECYEWS